MGAKGAAAPLETPAWGQAPKTPKVQSQVPPHHPDPAASRLLLGLAMGVMDVPGRGPHSRVFALQGCKIAKNFAPAAGLASGGACGGLRQEWQSAGYHPDTGCAFSLPRWADPKAPALRAAAFRCSANPDLAHAVCSVPEFLLICVP